MTEPKPTHYSNNDIERAGKAFLNEKIEPEEFSEAMNVLSFWRSSHEKSLDTAFKAIQDISSAIDKKAIFAKRLKRYVSIVNKLKRFDSMNLRNMQDIGGCRVIVNSKKKLYKIVRLLKKCPEFRDSKGKVRYKDYIDNPKSDGYRCYHLVGKFGNSTETRNIEVQIRTNLQHSWATALEIVDLFTNQSLKHNVGNKDWLIFFQSISKLFALIESINLFQFKDLDCQKLFINKINTNKELEESAKTVKQLSKKLDIKRKFEAFTGSLKIIDDKILNDQSSGYLLIEIDMNTKNLNARLFDNKNGIIAEQEYTNAEKIAAEKTDIIIALVSTASLGDIREAYPNYFADSTEFIKHLILILKLIEQNSPSFWNIFE